ncbi:MAG TPA: phosphoribosylformylglycinamidine synthase subunit PurS, partial [Polyangia bacterium]
WRPIAGHPDPDLLLEPESGGHQVDWNMEGPMKVRVSVQLKPGILDPQGKAVEQGLHGFGFEVDHVRIGRLIEMDVPGKDPSEVKAKALAMCEKLLVNPVMEKASIEVL